LTGSSSANFCRTQHMGGTSGSPGEVAEYSRVRHRWRAGFMNIQCPWGVGHLPLLVDSRHPATEASTPITISYSSVRVDCSRANSVTYCTFEWCCRLDFKTTPSILPFLFFYQERRKISFMELEDSYKTIHPQKTLVWFDKKSRSHAFYKEKPALKVQWKSSIKTWFSVFSR